MTRANPFADLSDFETAPATKPVPVAAIEEIAEQAGFPSRKPRAAKAAATKAPEPIVVEPVRTVRRYTTGRNRQINIKATDATIERLYRLADERGVPLGALLDQALDALEASAD